MQNQRIRIRLKAFDYKLIDASTAEIVETANPRIDITEDEMSEAYSIGLQNYMQTQGDKVDEGELQEFLANV